MRFFVAIALIVISTPPTPERPRPPGCRRHCLATVEARDPTRNCRHPCGAIRRFDDDFAKEMPSDVDEDRWILQQAAVWPDMARGLRGDDRTTYDHPTWHYVNFPLFVGDKRPLIGVNLSTDFPPIEPQVKWNVAQAVKFCVDTLNTTARRLTRRSPTAAIAPRRRSPPANALDGAVLGAISDWRSRRAIPSRRCRNENLHSLWAISSEVRTGRMTSSEPSRSSLPPRDSDQRRSNGDVEDWIAESHELAKSFAYAPEIIAAVQTDGELQPINLPKQYLTSAGSRARQRIVAADFALVR